MAEKFGSHSKIIFGMIDLNAIRYRYMYQHEQHLL